MLQAPEVAALCCMRRKMIECVPGSSVPKVVSHLKKSDLLLKPVPVLRGVLGLPAEPAYRIEAPVRQSLQ